MNKHNNRLITGKNEFMSHFVKQSTYTEYLERIIMNTHIKFVSLTVSPKLVSFPVKNSSLTNLPIRMH
jgi:hypothetical protein